MTELEKFVAENVTAIITEYGGIRPVSDIVEFKDGIIFFDIGWSIYNIGATFSVHAVDGKIRKTTDAYFVGDAKIIRLTEYKFETEKRIAYFQLLKWRELIKSDPETAAASTRENVERVAINSGLL